MKEGQVGRELAPIEKWGGPPGPRPIPGSACFVGRQRDQGSRLTLAPQNQIAGVFQQPLPTRGPLSSYQCVNRSIRAQPGPASSSEPYRAVTKGSGFINKC